MGVEHRERVAGQAEGGVDEDGAVGGAGGGEQFGDALQEDGHVHRGRRRAARCCSSSTASRTVRGLPAMVPRAAVRRWDAGGPVERDRADGAGGARRWGRAVGRRVGRWGEWSGVGPGAAEGARPGRRARPPRGPPGVGEERQVAPRGGGVGSPLPLRCASLRCRVGTQPRGRRLGPGPGRAAGKAARSGAARGAPGAAGWRDGDPGITTASASPRSPCRRRPPPARPRRPPSWRRPRSRSGCPRRR